MTLINVLDERLINKIAAGEVIERPASVVKELVENSIDAGATQIDVTIEDYGKRLIKVTDNGSGMPEEDAKISILRHTTSKIKNDDDLYNINTLGFRGEALASIAAVSHLTISTKTDSTIEGFKIEVEGGKVVGNSAAGVPKGTIIEVRDLFFNTPARLKFMKTDTNELKHIVDIVTRYALINPKVSIRLQHNGHSLVNSPTSEDMLNNISSIYGNDVAKQLLEVKYEDINVYVTGYISKPSLLKSDKSMQSLYVNGRYVKDDTVEKALYDAYHTLLFVDRHPVVILNIRVDPTVIDVNIHPTKEKVKFEQASKIYDSIFNSVRQTLLENSLITDFSSLDSSEQAILEEKKPEKPKAEIRREKGYIYISKENQTFVLPDVQPSEAEMYSAGLLSKSEWKEKKLQKGNAKLPDMRLVGQVMKTFFLAETAEGLLIIDQHVVQERVLYERYMGQYMNKSISHQSLLSPLVVEVPPEDSVFLQANIDQVKSFGFDAEHFGDNSFTLRAVPSIFEKVETKQAFMDLVSELSANKSLSMEMKQEDIITRMACRASIKAGDDVTIPYMEGLLKELDACTLPYTCPHGRPIFIRFTLDDLEKMFRRK